MKALAHLAGLTIGLLGGLLLAFVVHLGGASHDAAGYCTGNTYAYTPPTSSSTSSTMPSQHNAFLNSLSAEQDAEQRADQTPVNRTTDETPPTEVTEEICTA